MKRFIPILLAVFTVLLFLPGAYAATITVDPVGFFEPLDTTMDFTVFLDPEGSSLEVAAFHIDFTYDSGELTYVATDVVLQNFFDLGLGDYGRFLGSTEITETTALLQIEFDVTNIDPWGAFETDFEITSASIFDASYNKTVLGLGSAAIGADVGYTAHAAPIPGALWLLGSGLVTLVGIRKKLLH